jgi:hypothetical protein
MAPTGSGEQPDRHACGIIRRMSGAIHSGRALEDGAMPCFQRMDRGDERAPTVLPSRKGFEHSGHVLEGRCASIHLRSR